METYAPGDNYEEDGQMVWTWVPDVLPDLRRSVRERKSPAKV